MPECNFRWIKGSHEKSCSFHTFNGFLCNFLVFPLLIYGAPSGTTAEKVAVSILSMGFFAVFELFLCFGALHRGKQLIKLQLPMRSCTIFLGKSASRWDQMFPQVSTHTVGMAFWCLPCFIAKNITPSDGRFRRFSRYSMFICHQFFVAHLCHQGVTPYNNI